MLIKLTSQDITFILAHIPSGPVVEKFAEAQARGPYVTDAGYQTDSHHLRLSPEELWTIRDQLLDIFATIGLNYDSEPNAMGIYIESLIDILSGRQ